MNEKAPKRGLGRGLGALIPTAPPAEDVAAAVPEGRHAGPHTDAHTGGVPAQRGLADGSFAVDDGESAGVDAPGRPAAGFTGNGHPAAGAYFAEIPLDRVVPNPRQPRQVFEEEALAELVHSIREVGLLQPVVVRPTGPDSFELVMGERRWRACVEAGQEAIPAIVRATDDDDMLRDALLENLHRSQLNPLEEAAAYGQMLDDFACTHEELAHRIGRSRPQISNTLRLMRLSPAVQRRVAAGVISAGHARALLGVEDGEQQDALAQRVVSEGISVRGLEELVAVGDGASAQTRRKRPHPTAPGLDELSERLSARLETRVKVDLGRKKGKITVEYASLEDLRRIVDVIDPPAAGDHHA